jgi:hypothetical protein
MISIEEFKLKAFSIFGKYEYLQNNRPLDFLVSVKWNTPSGQAFSQDIMTQMNLDLDDRSCFGRTVKMAVLLEKYFPEEKLFFGEVLSDFFRELLVQNASFLNWQDPSYLDEILQYEDPHSVIVLGDGNHFDPIFKSLNPKIAKNQHPKVAIHDLWGGLYAAFLISYALKKQLSEGDEVCLAIIEEAEKASPLMVAKENKVGVLTSLGKPIGKITHIKSGKNRSFSIVIYTILLFLLFIL